MDHRINIKVSEEQRTKYKLCAKMLGLDLTKLTIKSLEKYIDDNLKNHESKLELEIFKLEKELEYKKRLLKINKEV
jgi:hypothetical protein